MCVLHAANVNDRSMTGERDSEVAVRVEDKEMVSKTLSLPSLLSLSLFCCMMSYVHVCACI